MGRRVAYFGVSPVIFLRRATFIPSGPDNEKALDNAGGEIPLYRLIVSTAPVRLGAQGTDSLIEL